MIRFFCYTSSNGENSERVCEPMGLALKGYIWYLYGFCKLREDFRIFRLSRIEQLTVLPDRFERRLETLEQLDYRWQRSHDPVCVRLVLQFHPRVKAKVQDYFEQGQIAAQLTAPCLLRVSSRRTVALRDAAQLWRRCYRTGTGVGGAGGQTKSAGSCPNVRDNTDIMLSG